MEYDKLAQHIYTTRITMYHWFIHYMVGYAQGVKKYFVKSSVLPKGAPYLQPGTKVLDAGCGSGLVTNILYNIAKKKNISNVTFYGFDLTPAMLDRFRIWIKKDNVTNIHLAQADVLKPEQLPADWKEFDLITVSGMLEHLPKHRITEAISNLKKLLKQDGRLVIFICRKNPLAYWVIKKWWQAETYTKQEMQTIMHNAGFSSVDFHRFPFPYNYMNSWVHIIDAKKN
jgi:ubiquinone/menaquinone biosynthesis C-methylase UbiE